MGVLWVSFDRRCWGIHRHLETPILYLAAVQILLRRKKHMSQRDGQLMLLISNGWRSRGALL
jgi:hypothetical protein